MSEKRRQVVLYQSDDGSFQLEAKLEAESIWLSMAQIATLFHVNVPAVSKHIKNIYTAKELSPKATVSKMETVRQEGKRQVIRAIDFYNLDMIISVGYRVNSKQATLFRIWATNVLKQHLIQGYTLNQKRLQQIGYTELEAALTLVSRAIGRKEPDLAEAKGLLDVITRYAKSWLLLQQYDEDRLLVPGKSDGVPSALAYAEAREAIVALKKDLKAKGAASDLFGKERGDSLEGILGALEQTFGGQALYPSVEAKAAHVLYFIIKDHPFIDGNKRIGSLLFILFLAKNRSLYRANGEAKINDNALVALALLIAESDPGHKDILIKLVINLLWEAAK
jgi:prophage maintenance system killer protein